MNRVPLLRCGWSFTISHGVQSLARDERTFRCTCLFHPLEVSGGKAPCGHLAAGASPAAILELANVQERDLARWRRIITARVAAMPLESVRQSFGDGIPDAPEHPTTLAGAAYLALTCCLGDETRLWLWQQVEPRISELEVCCG